MPSDHISVNTWVPDTERLDCVECRREFTFFTRRHHCRRCGEIFCSACSKYQSAEIPGLRTFSGKKLRVCRSCYVSHLAYLVVRMRVMAGPTYELFGSKPEAEKYIKGRCDAIMLQMATGRVVAERVTEQRRGARLTSKAIGVRNQLMGGYEHALQTHLDDSSRVSLTDSPGFHRVRSGANTIVFLSYTNDRWLAKCVEIRGGTRRDQAVEGFIKRCRETPIVTKAVVLTLRDLTPLQTYTNSMISRTVHIVMEAQGIVASYDWVLSTHVGGHPKARVIQSLPAALEAIDRLPADCSACLVDQNFDVVATQRCEGSQSFVDELHTTACEVLQREYHQVDLVAVVSQREVKPVCASIREARINALQERTTHKKVTAVVGFRRQDIPSLVPSTTTVDDLESGRFVVSSQALRTLFVLVPAANTTDEFDGALPIPAADFIPAHRFDQAAKLLAVDAVKRQLLAAASMSTREQMGSSSDREDGAAAITSGGSPGVPSVVKPPLELPECDVCFLNLGTEGSRRPVMCPECANTICLECWLRVPNCPMDRAPKPAQPRFNVALMRVIASMQSADVTPPSSLAT